MILTREQMLVAERLAFDVGVNASDLMESAGRQMAEFVVQNHPLPGRCMVFAGKGHNGGDVLVAARHLAGRGWKCEVVLPERPLAPLTEAMLDRLDAFAGPDPGGPLVVLDGLLGIGVKDDPRGPIAAAIQEILSLRQTRAAWVLAADLPSGLDADTGKPGSPCVRADATMTMGFAKTGLVADEATPFVGRLAVAPLDGLAAVEGASPEVLIDPAALRKHIPPRGFDTHKGMAGRVAVVAGSLGFLGAARLCSAAAVAGGAGLVTLFARREAYPLLATSVVPEVMVRPVDSFGEVLDARWDAAAIGPGLSRQFPEETLSLVAGLPCPAVVDADALNEVSTCSEILARCAGPRLLTPHPGEMERLSPCCGRTRREWLADFVSRYPVTLLLKGSRTIVGQAGRPPAYNCTGHPGMASGGMGDVLTGVAAALLAQGLPPFEAAAAAAWVCGRAAEIAVSRSGESQESLRASHVLDHLGPAFGSLRAGEF